MGYDERIVKITTINMQNKNNIDVLNCNANTRSSYTTKTASNLLFRHNSYFQLVVHFNLVAFCLTS